MIFKNLRELNAGYDSQESAFINVALSAYEEAVKACDPHEAILRNLKLEDNNLLFNNKIYNLDAYKNIYVIGAGKAGYKMTKAIYDLLGDRITEGCVCIPQNSDFQIEMMGKIRFMQCAHPIPDMDSVLSARMITTIANKAQDNDLIIFLLSGGASSLMCLPIDGISLADKQKVNNLLLKSGADITEINTVRKQLSGIKGGKLAEIAYPAEVIQLVLSDVIGNSLDIIGSGPFVKNKTTSVDAINILKKYSLLDSIPESVNEVLTANRFGKTKNNFWNDSNKKNIDKITTTIIADNKLALTAAGKFLEDYEFKIYYYPQPLTGEASLMSKDFFDFLANIKKDNLDSFAVIAGGEPVVTLKKNNQGDTNFIEFSNMTTFNSMPKSEYKNPSKPQNIAELGEILKQKQKKNLVSGGRAQELALSMLKYLISDRERHMFFLAAGTDGIDGPTDASGAIISAKTIHNAQKISYKIEDYLLKHDSYNFFNNVGGLIKTGYTGTNVNDIFIGLVPPKLD